MRTGLSAALAITCLFSLAGCASQRPAPAYSPPAGFLTSEGEAAWHAFIAELALQRDQRDTAAREYLQAAKLSADPRLAERAARIAYMEDALAVASEAAGLWSAREPQNLEAHRLLASVAIRQSDAEAAVPHLATMLAGGPEEREGAWLMLMVVLNQERDKATALEALRLLVASHADEAEAHFALAALALDADDTPLALESARTAVRLKPEWPRAGLMLARAQVADGRLDEALETARRVVEQDGDDQVRLEFAGLLADAGRLDEAREVLAEVLGRRPDLPDALLAAGLLEIRAGNPDAARMHFTGLLGTGKRNLDALYYLAIASEQLGESANALQLYLRIRSGRHFPNAQIKIGQLLFKLGQREAAIEHLRTFARHFPRHSESAVLAEGGLLTELGEMDEALELYTEELEKNPEARTVRYARALLYEQLDMVPEALADLYDLVESDPEDPSALNALGYTLADRTDRYQEALEYLEAALARLPDDPAVLDSMGWVHYRLGNLDLALDFLERAWAALKDPEVAAHFGEVLWVTGSRDRARAIWAEAREADPDHDTLTETLVRLVGEEN